jgi:hypothetical protein
MRSMRAGLTTVLAFALAACTSGKGGAGVVDAPDASKDASREDASVGACARGGDCFAIAQAASSVYCCTDNVCTPRPTRRLSYVRHLLSERLVSAGRDV